ncbi:hypothetical protein GMOD_00004142 [Pyrenophora seminiperda CCB06]|uniref:Uncharacterized protein n=1 Tax=Pyrenophora seminiperda CCB06 TaxID=1302712 RepID=A0A3M7M0Q7_9PLEO|nr:hypothetical protein GMOD_00004142 [Pyrenophora seminiperda CCB06]
MPSILAFDSDSASAPPPSSACWTSQACLFTLSDFTYCYHVSGPVTPSSTPSLPYQSCLCNPSLPYLHLRYHTDLDPNTNASNCLACMTQAGVDNALIAKFIETVDGFCSSKSPDLKGLFMVLLSWLQGTGETVEGNTALDGIQMVTTLPGWDIDLSATTTSGGGTTTTTTPTTTTNVKTKSPPAPTSTPSHSPSPTPLSNLPKYLTQLPPNWPYTSPAIARHAGWGGWKRVYFGFRD